MSNMHRSEITDLKGVELGKKSKQKKKIRRVFNPIGFCMGLLLLSGINEGVIKAREVQWDLLIESPAKQAEALNTSCETLPKIVEVESNLRKLGVTKGHIWQPIPIPDGLIYETWRIDDRYKGVLGMIDEAAKTCESEKISDKQAEDAKNAKPEKINPNQENSINQALAATLNELRAINRENFNDVSNNRIEKKLIEDGKFNYPDSAYLYPLVPLHLGIRYLVLPTTIIVFVYLYRGVFMMILIVAGKMLKRVYVLFNIGN
ncbi:MAG: hypothetical protein ACRCXZ_08815 [Patescibacteria group bacterium]